MEDLLTSLDRKYMYTVQLHSVHIHLSKQHAHVEAEIHVTEEPAIVPVENIYLFANVKDSVAKTQHKHEHNYRFTP